MENNRQTGMYIIDDNYKMIYMNQVTKDMYPEVNEGDICYKALGHLEEACLHCPIRKQEEALFYNPSRKEWISAQAASMELPGYEKCYSIQFRIKDKFAETNYEPEEPINVEEHLNVLGIGDGTECLIGGYCEENYPMFYVNENTLKLLGYDTREEFVEAMDGLLINTIHPDDRYQANEDIFADKRAGATYETVYRMPKKDGTWFMTINRGTIVETESGRLAIISYITDVSGFISRQNELWIKNGELMAKESITEAMMSNMPSGYHRCAAKPGCPFLYISDKFEEIVGWTREEIESDLGNLYENLVWPEDKDAMTTYEDMMRMRGQGNSYSTDIYRMKRKGGGYRWVLDSTMYVDMGEDSFFQATLADITEFIENEKKQQRLLEEANNAKTQFLSSMSHDIRTPMNAIIGMTTLASKHLDDPDYMKKCLGKMSLASRHLLTLINDVLDISKVESGKMVLNPIVFSLSDTVTNLVNIVRQQITEKGLLFNIRVHNIYAEHLFGDELRLNQIFINLLSNAVKYTPTGGQIWMDLKEESVEGHDDLVRLTYVVEDTGIGMSQEFQQNMYESFVRADAKNYGNMQGTGLGLTISKRMVDLMDGDIQCESELGQGTKFTVTITLPIADRIMEELILPPIDTLLVDDDEVFLESAAETLRVMGVTPYCVKSGAEAIVAAKERHRKGNGFPVIIVDWKMPGMDGVETIRRIRAEVGEDVSIIVVSAYEWEEIGQEAIDAGANGFISKPFFPSSVFENMQEILGLASHPEEDYVTPDERLQGMNILVAEDNDINWEIAEEILGMYGVTTTRAENGQECVDILRNSRDKEYDMVLMDIRMPILDGYGATQVIRESAREYVRNIPIVAMTADAFSDDILKCMEIGMNGHLAKPINIKNLLTVLSHTIGGGTASFVLKSLKQKKDN